MSNTSFNNLTPAEVERLSLLAEEAGEVIQAIGKILRHGYESRHPKGGPSNRKNLEREIADFCTAVDIMCDVSDLSSSASDLSKASINRFKKEKARKVAQYLHHQDDYVFSASDGESDE